MGVSHVRACVCALLHMQLYNGVHVYILDVMMHMCRAAEIAYNVACALADLHANDIMHMVHFPAALFLHLSDFSVFVCSWVHSHVRPA